MTYSRFIKVLRQYQTPHVKALAFPQSCAPSKIPNAFRLLLPDIIELLESHIDQFCAQDQVMALFGLQPGSVALTSSAPGLLNRISNAQYPDTHLCCSLAYLTLSKQQLKQIQSWHGSQNIIVDFTTGLVMDGPRYLSQVFAESPKGIVYGSLNPAKLAMVWAIVNRSKEASSTMEIARAA